MACYIPRWYTRPKTVTHPGINRARRALTSFIRRTPLITTRRRQRKYINTTHGTWNMALGSIWTSLHIHCICGGGSPVNRHSRWTALPSWTHSSRRGSVNSGFVIATANKLQTDCSTPSTSRHSNTHTHPFHGHFSGTTRASRYQKSKPI